MNRAIDALFDALEPRAFSAASASDILTWAMFGLALFIGLTYGSEWIAKGCPYKPYMAAARRGGSESRVSPRRSPAALQRQYGKTRFPLQSVKPVLFQATHERRPTGRAALEKI